MNGLRLAALAVLATAAVARADTYGRLEHVRVVADFTIEVTARLEPSAPGSTLQAVDVKYFQREGGTWVRFTIDNGSVLPGSRITLEKRVLRDERVRQKGGGVEHRPQIELPLCIGDRRLDVRLALLERSSYTAPLLIGASEIAQLGAVDAGRQFMHEPSCSLDARP